MQLKDYQEEFVRCSEAVRQHGLTWAIAVNAGILANNLRKSLWRPGYKSEALAIAERFEAVSRFHQDNTRDHWETVPADQVPSELLAAKPEPQSKSFSCVGTVGRGEFPAAFAGPDGKPVLFSGGIRVHRVGGLEEFGRQFVFECAGHCWAEVTTPRWYSEQGEPIEPLTESKGAQLAVESDYYDRILPALRRLEWALSAEANPADLEPIRVGLVDCWQFKRETQS